MESKNKIDTLDKNIISHVFENPTISMTDLGDCLDVSQVTISNRILKLREKGYLQKVCGINFNVADYILLRADVQTKLIDNGFIEDLIQNPNIWNVFGISGDYNLSIYAFESDLKKCYNLFETIFRKYDINKYSIEVITGIIKQPILSMYNFNFEKKI